MPVDYKLKQEIQGVLVGLYCPASNEFTSMQWMDYISNCSYQILHHEETRFIPVALSMFQVDLDRQIQELQELVNEQRRLLRQAEKEQAEQEGQDTAVKKPVKKPNSPWIERRKT